MKKIIPILFVAIAIAAQAQNAQITSPDGGMNVYRKVKKQAYDPTNIPRHRPLCRYPTGTQGSANITSF